ncbi:hypothetical protein DWB61_06020 [Ancylomarina euxinus]|uniref:Uncharacterized protein n=1 Tax=Ancylomarina euxinus TaxID=2283627 RepID=A0A425Y436_9BACT|nr:hypothetical protein [Ancylomarina euxinus]MCZ4694594.1 hypothetical protein [Ancylomarina euxinus]MUP14137.1 hypothetical protein [Ancylomarina euxinus]RRG22992.1 hypothetical protein DWB61_06020 [Ancylomarina euxinus]
MSRISYYKGLFLVAAIYDLILGLVFLFFSRWAFKLIGISDKLPEFIGYLSLIGAFLLVIGLAYFLIYKGDLQKNIDLILVGLMYKLAYCSIAFFYALVGNIPHFIFFALFGILDLIMLILMLECYMWVSKNR